MPRPAHPRAANLTYGPARRDAKSRCDVLLDLSGGAPLFPAADLRDGYLRADPGDPAAVLRAVLKARELTGSFDKPRYVTFTEDLCAHSRSKIVGCRRCLDLCPTGAITPNGDHVAIDAAICAGCGQCAAACPTGAAAYALPPSDALLRQLRALLAAYRQAGGKQAVLLFHDAEHGAKLIDALARHGDGLPANVLPVAVNEVTQVGLEAVAAAFAYGTSAVRFLVRAKPRHDLTGLTHTVALAQPILAGLGFSGVRVATIETDDPDALGDTLRAMSPMDAAAKPATFAAVGLKRDVVRHALRELYGVAPAPVDIVPLPQGAPFGTVEVRVEGCTLCLSCVSGLPDRRAVGRSGTADAAFCRGRLRAMRAVPGDLPRESDQPSSRRSISARPPPRAALSSRKSLILASAAASRSASRVRSSAWWPSSKASTGCSRTPRSAIEVIKMCADCRVSAMAEENFDPFGGPNRPAVRTTDDYLRERDLAKLKQEYDEKQKS